MRPMKARYFTFEPFCLDVLDERLWNGGTSVPLGRKAFAVLARLVSHPNQLVTKDDLLATVWADTAVSESVLTTAMRELRAAVADDAHAPRFIGTVYGRGYRFIAPVTETTERPPARFGAGGAGANSSGPDLRGAGDRILVGREPEWACLLEWYKAAEHGRRQIGFIAGEAGIGKTLLVDAFVEWLAETTAVRIARGQCIEQYGAGEAYLPVLEAIGRLAHDVRSGLARVLQDHAPSWLAHLPSLASGATDRVTRVRPERMLRELAEAVEVFTAAAPLILVLEDVHWSDSATLQWLSYVARRRDPARLLVLATYRPVEALVHESPVRRVLADLRSRTQAREVVLDYLPQEAVRAYLKLRWGDTPETPAHAAALHRRTGGHPLFLASIVDELAREGGASPTGVGAADLDLTTRALPPNVRQFIEHRFGNLTAIDRSILEAASVAGESFLITCLAAATPHSEERIEGRCAALADTHRVLVADGFGTWPDGTRSVRYRFRHALFHETAYARTSPELRARLHLAVGLRLEAAYGRQAPTIAAELAVHFEQGRHLDNAVSYLEQAARNAVQRSAYSEAHHHLTRAIALIHGLPETRGRLRREARLTLLLAQVFETTKGWGVEEVATAYDRARALSAALGDQAQVLAATWGLIAVSVVRAELRSTRVLSGELLRLAKKRRDPMFRMAAHAELGGTALALGQTRSARRHFRLAEALEEGITPRASIAAFGMDLGIFARIWATHLMWHEGYPDRARTSAGQTIAAAAERGHPFTHTIVLAYAAMLGQFRRDAVDVERLSGATIAQATEHGFPYYLAWAEVLRGWSRAAQGAGAPALDDMRGAIEALQATAGLRLPYYKALLAEACGVSGCPDEGLRSVSEGLRDVQRTGECWWEAELHRLRGELLLRTSVDADAEAEQCFRIALDVARRLRALPLELRAAVSLARLMASRGNRTMGSMLTRVYGAFTEGLDTADLIEARALLATIQHSSSLMEL